MSENKETQLINDVIKKFNWDEDLYNKIADFLQCCLRALFEKEAMDITARTKTKGSIVGKILKKYIQLNDENKIYGSFTDFVGARVIFLRRDLVDAADAKIHEYFKVDDSNSQNAADRLNEREFGYQSRHYIICINKEWIEKITDRFQEKYGESLRSKGNVVKQTIGERTIFAELQIRTCLQHVWADLTHDRIYKGDLVIPREFLRSWNALAAILENADEEIVERLKQLEQYRKDPPYYSKADLDKKITTLELITEVQIEESDKTRENNLILNRDELMRLYRMRGNDNRDLLTRIADYLHQETPMTVNLDKPEQLKALLKNDLTNPKLLLYYLSLPVPSQNSNDEILAHILNYLLNEAIQRCDDMIQTSSELPWAFAGKAFFKLHLLETDKSQRNESNVSDIYESILRLIDLCNEHSVANFGDALRVATQDTKNALEKLSNAVNVSSFSQWPLDEGAAPVVENVKLLLELGIYAHIHTKETTAKPHNPVVIIAGGCDSLVGQDGRDIEPLSNFKELFKESLNGSNSIDFYTGVGSGICSLVFSPNTVTKIDINGNSSPYHKSSPCNSGYSKHSIYEALLIWDEIKNQNYRFDEVALVGFGLGKISSLECRIALALGARITVISHKDFARSYERTFEGIPHWSNHPNRVCLPLIRGSKPKNWSYSNNCAKSELSNNLRNWGFPEPIMLRTFMLFRPYHQGDDNKEDDMVLLLQRIKQLRTFIDYQDLKDLDNVKQRSARHRLLSFLELYKDAYNRNPPDLTIEGSLAHIFTSDNLPAALKECKECLDKLHNEAEKLNIYYEYGEREHARWYIERWLQGTRYGENKIDRNVSNEQMKNPCMVAWYDLDNDTISKDTEFLFRYIVAKWINEHHAEEFENLWARAQHPSQPEAVAQQG